VQPGSAEASHPPAAAESPLTINPNDSVDEILLKLKARLDRLYELARKAPSRGRSGT